MSNYYLDFEKPIKVLDDQIISLSSLTDPSKNDLQSLTNLKEEVRLNSKYLFGINKMAAYSIS